MKYAFNCLHFFIVGVLAVGSPNLSIASLFAVRVFFTRCVAVCFEESEGSKSVCPALLVFVKDRPAFQKGRGVFFIRNLTKQRTGHDFSRISK